MSSKDMDSSSVAPMMVVEQDLGHDELGNARVMEHDSMVRHLDEGSVKCCRGFGASSEELL